MSTKSQPISPSTGVDRLVIALEMALKADLERAKRVRQLLRDQNDALVNARATESATIGMALDDAANQQESFDELRQAAIEDLTEALGFSADGSMTLSQLIARLNVDSRPRLTRLVQNLRAVHEEARTLSSRNTTLASNALSLTQDWLRILTGAILTPGVYGQQSSCCATPSLLLDQRA